MLIQFSIKNFKCFKEEVKLSMVASNYDKATREESNIFEVEKFGLRLLKSAVVYGANASGKTKLIEGLGFMKNFIYTSSKESQINEAIDTDPFRLNSETLGEPSVFEIIFIHENNMYRYGFEVDKKQVHAEWLYRKSKIKEVELFYRENQNFEVHRTFKVADLVENDRVRPNALLLSVAANFNDKIGKKIFDWFRSFNIISGLREEGYEGFSMSKISKDEQSKKRAVKFLKSADLGIEDLAISKMEINDLPEGMPDEMKDFLRKQMKERDITEFASGVSTYHQVFDTNNLFEDLSEFSMEEDESSGTKKYFALSGLILETLEKGEILIVDELTNKLHPNLVCKLMELFNSKEKNPNNAQIIFNTHDTNLLSSGIFRRDQIWFTEKDRYGASSLYSLGSFKSDTVRKEDNYEKNYIRGKYGAIPYLGDFDKLFTF